MEIPKPSKYRDAVTTIKPTTGPNKSWSGSNEASETKGSKKSE